MVTLYNIEDAVFLKFDSHLETERTDIAPHNVVESQVFYTANQQRAMLSTVTDTILYECVEEGYLTRTLSGVGSEVIVSYLAANVETQAVEQRISVHVVTSDSGPLTMSVDGRVPGPFDRGVRSHMVMSFAFADEVVEVIVGGGSEVIYS